MIKADWIFVFGLLVVLSITTFVNSFSKENEKMKRYEAVIAHPKVLLIHCSDPRFQVAFNGFIQGELGLKPGEFVAIVGAGGPGALAHPATTSKMQDLKDQIVFFLKHFPSIKKVVLINHQDCGFYELIPNPQNKKENRERDDLPTAAEAVSYKLSAEGIQGIVVEAYYAKFANANHDSIIFERL